MEGLKEGYAFIIDTDSYAGNFEREMTAYLTGQIGECGVGDEMTERLPSDIKESFDGNVQQVPDEHGCYRPTSAVPEPSTSDPKIGFPSGQYNSVAIFFHDMPSQDEIDFMKERVKGFDKEFKSRGRMAVFNKKEPEIKILGFRMVEVRSTENEISI